MDRCISVSQLRSNAAALVSEAVARSAQPIVIMRGGKRVAVLVSYEEYEYLAETETELLAPMILEAMADEGESITLEELTRKYGLED